MSHPLNINDLGFGSWFEFFEWLKTQDLDQEQRVTLTWPAEPGDPAVEENAGEQEPERPDLTLHVSTVRSHAFNEIFPKLPTKAAIDVVMDLIWAPEKSQGDMNTIEAFLKNLPTRSI